jgi:hypothetical protein
MSAVHEDRELIQALRSHIETRRRVARSRLDELTRRRAAMSARERELARESLRSQVSAVRSELARLRLADSLATALQRHSEM